MYWSLLLLPYACSNKDDGVCIYLLGLQELVGGPEAFDRFLKAYIEAKRFHVHTSDDMKAFFCDFFADVPAIKQIDWQAWLYAPGCA